MASRFFTSDLHFCSVPMIEEGLRPFESVEDMNNILIDNINSKCGEDDILIHCGDFIQYGNDRQYSGMKINPTEFIRKINPIFVNIEGNHDPRNKMKSVCSYMRTTLGNKYDDVSVSHYPSTDPMASGTFRKGDIHIHGHNHNGPIFIIDTRNSVLNVNVCCELWRYLPVSEDELITKIDIFMKHMNEINKMHSSEV